MPTAVATPSTPAPGDDFPGRSPDVHGSGYLSERSHGDMVGQNMSDADTFPVPFIEPSTYIRMYIYICIDIIYIVYYIYILYIDFTFQVGVSINGVPP